MSRSLFPRRFPGACQIAVISLGLRAAGYDAQSVTEMGLNGAGDQQLNQLADQVGAKVLTRVVGHQIEGWFGSNAIQVDSRIRSFGTVLQLLGG